MAEACRFFETPITGGNVSLYNETLGTPIFPTPVMGIVGTLETAIPTGIHFKTEGQSVILLGGYGKAMPQFGATQYAKVIVDSLWEFPRLDMSYEKRVQTTIRELVRSRAVESAHDLSDGGLAVALAECCFGQEGVGADIQLDADLCASSAVSRGPVPNHVSTGNPEAVLAAGPKNSIEAIEMALHSKKNVLRNRTETLVDCLSLS